jgi:hypothetical protein
MVVATNIELGITRVPLWKRPYADHPVGRPTRPASTLADEPWFHVKIGESESVSVIVKLIRTTSGDIEAQVETRKALNV